MTRAGDPSGDGNEDGGEEDGDEEHEPGDDGRDIGLSTLCKPQTFVNIRTRRRTAERGDEDGRYVPEIRSSASFLITTGGSVANLEGDAHLPLISSTYE